MIGIGLASSPSIGGGIITPTPSVYDEFIGTNGTDLTSHSIAPTNSPATSWTSGALGGAIATNGGMALQSGGDALYYVTVPWTNYDIESLIIPPVFMNTGVALWVQDLDNYMAVFVSPSSNGNYDVTIREKALTFTVVGTFSVSSGDTNPVLLVTVRGQLVTASIGASSVSWTTALTLGAGHVGLVTDGTNNAAAWGYFKVTRR